MTSSPFVSTFAAATAALFALGAGSATVGEATTTAPPTSEPARSEPTASDPDVRGESIDASADHDLSAEEEAAFNVEVEFAHCMRDHGIEGLPDPQVTDDGFVLVGFPLVLPDGWDAAQDACQHIFDDAASPDETGATAGWEKVVPGGDCECADGSEFAFWERRADPTKVVLFLDGGGTCYDAKSCAFTVNV